MQKLNASLPDCSTFESWPQRATTMSRPAVARDVHSEPNILGRLMSLRPCQKNGQKSMQSMRCQPGHFGWLTMSLEFRSAPQSSSSSTVSARPPSTAAISTVRQPCDVTYPTHRHRHTMQERIAAPPTYMQRHRPWASSPMRAVAPSASHRGTALARHARRHQSRSSSERLAYRILGRQVGTAVQKQLHRVLVASCCRSHQHRIAHLRRHITHSPPPPHDAGTHSSPPDIHAAPTTLGPPRP